MPTIDEQDPTIDFKSFTIPNDCKDSNDSNYCDPNTFPIAVNFQSKVKIITQSQEVDVHSLIGNIGGYIGLFLGMILLEL